MTIVIRNSDNYRMNCARLVGNLQSFHLVYKHKEPQFFDPLDLLDALVALGWEATYCDQKDFADYVMQAAKYRVQEMDKQGVIPDVRVAEYKVEDAEHSYVYATGTIYPHVFGPIRDKSFVRILVLFLRAKNMLEFRQQSYWEWTKAHMNREQSLSVHVG